MKTQKALRIITICLLVCSLFLIISAAYTVVNGIYETHSATAKSDIITLNSTNDNVYHYLSVSGATVLSIYKTRDNSTSVETIAVDLLVFTQSTLTQTPYKKVNLSDGSYCYIFNVEIGIGVSVAQFTFTPTSASDVTVVAVKAAEIKDGNVKTIANMYIASFFELKLINDQSHYQGNQQITNKSQSYCNIWLLDNVTVDTDYTLFVPAYINLLFSTLTLKGDLTIKHSFGGLFTIEGEGGSIYSLPDAPKTVYIKAPKAYYSVSYLTSEFLINTVLDQTATEFELTDSTDLKTKAVFDDALVFALDHIPDSVFSDVLLAQKYQNFDLTYAYLLDGEPVTNWIPQRQSSDQVITVDVTVLFKGAVVNHAQKTVTVIGTNDLSVATSAVNAIKAQISEHFDFDENQKITNFNKKCDIFNALGQVIRDSQISTPISVSISDINGVKFVYGENVFNSFILSYNSSTQEYTLTVGENVYNLNKSNKIYIKPATFIENNSNVFLSVSINGQNADGNFVLAGNSRAELETYILRMANTPYVMTIDDITYVYYLLDGKLSLFGSMLMDIHSFENIQSGTVLISQEQYDALTAEEAQIEDFIDQYSFAGFSVTEGVLSANTQISHQEGYVYVFYQNFSYSTSSIYYDADNPSFTVYKPIIIPVGGIGGDAYQKFLSDTFAAYFDSLPNNKLLDTSNFAPLTSSEDVFMSLRFTDKNGETIDYDYCKFLSESDNYLNLVNSVEKTRGFKIDIAIDKVPPVNTTVYMTVEFFTVSPVLSSTSNAVETYYVEGAIWDTTDLCFLSEGVPVTAASTDAVHTYYVEGAFWSQNSFYINTVLSTQRYSFIIPGIYFCSDVLSNAQFADRDFYDAIIFNIVNNIDLTVTVISDPVDADYNLNNFVFTVDQTDYLLADGAKIISSFSYLNSQVDIKGIRYLSNVTSLDFSGSLIYSLTDFSFFEGVKLTELNMSQCGLTDAKIGDNLYALKYLVNVDLSNNSITKLSDILYRTVIQLDLSQQANLTSIKGITGLNNLTVLDISQNYIDEFADLVKLNKLKTVKLKGNAGSESFYGTTGSVNIAEYVALMDKGVDVYASDTVLIVGSTFVYDNVTSSVSSITADQRLASLVLNGIFLSGVQYDYIIAPNIVNGYTVNAEAVKKQGVSQTFSVTVDEYGQNKITCPLLVDDDTVGLILSVTVNGTKVYKQFNLLYKN